MRKFPESICLAKVKSEPCMENDQLKHLPIITHENLSLFMSPSDEIDGQKEGLLPGILKDKHHRSTQLPIDGNEFFTDKAGNVYKTIRLKGNGLYSGPFRQHKGKIRNLKKDQSGFILGLQAKSEIKKAMEDFKKLIDIGFETEMPIFALDLQEVILNMREGVRRINFQEALRRCKLPASYAHISFAIRVDAMGTNNRLYDFSHADGLFYGHNFTGDEVKEFLLLDTINFMNLEKSSKQEKPELDLKLTQDNIGKFLHQTLNRLSTNLANLHKHNGIHHRITPDNLCMEGRIVDYDTLKWTSSSNTDCEKMKDAEFLKLLTSFRQYALDVLDFAGADPIDSAQLLFDLLSNSEELYYGTRY